MYFTFGEAYFGNAHLYFQIRRILVRHIWRTLKKAYLGVITTKYDFNTYFHIRSCIHMSNTVYLLIRMYKGSQIVTDIRKRRKR